MAKKSCKKGYYYCYSSKKCKRIPMGYYVGGGGWLRKEEEKSEDTEAKKNGNGNGANGNGNGNGGSNGGSNGGGVSEAWSAKYKKSIDCDNPKGFSQRAHCRGRKKVSEEAVSKKQQKFFGIVRAIQKGEIEPTTPETAKAAKDMKKSDVKKFASTKHEGLPEKKEVKEESNPRIPRKEGQPANSKKHSDLYTDENPKGTIHGLGFKDVATAKASVAKIKKSSRSHAHKIQAAIAMEQRARVMGKTSEAAVFRKFINSMKKKTKQMNEAKGGDHEVAMAQSQLKKSEENIKKLRKALGKKEKDIPAWMQAKITDTAHDTDAAAGYVDKMDEQYMTQQQRAERYAERLLNQAKGVARAYDAAKKAAKDVKTTSGSVTVREGTLHKWFKGSKSKDGKGGWVNVTTGGTCASDEPGEGVPKCVSRSKYESMTPAERRSASRRKKKKDRGQQSKRNAAKPTYVATDKPKKKTMNASYSNWRADLEQLDEFLAGRPGDGYIGHPNLDIKNPLAKKQVKKEVLPGSKGGGAVNRVGASIGDRNMRLNRMLNQSLELEGEVVEGYRDDGDIIRPGDKILRKNKKVLSDDDIKRMKDKGIPLDKAHYEPQGELVDEGKDVKGKGSGTKDACYHKVKSRYSVWPSAYASGALVKCRKVGAANWGNSKKESFSNWREDILLEGLEDKLSKMTPQQIEDLIKANKGAEKKIRDTLAKLKTATPNSKGKGAQLPNVPKQPASTSSYTSRETYQRGGSDRVSYQRKPRPTKPSPNVKFRATGSVPKPRIKMRGGKLGLALTAAAAAPFLINAIKKRMQPDIGVHKNMQKEGYDVSNWRDDFHATEYETVDIIKPEPLQPSQSVIDEAGKKCWKGYKKAGTQKLFGKTYNRCVKAHFSDWRADMELQEAIPGYENYNAAVAAAKGLKGRARIEALKAAAALRPPGVPPTEREVNQKLNEFNVRSGFIGFKVPLGRGGTNRTSGFTAGIGGGDKTGRGSAEVKISRTTNRIKATDPKTAVDDALKNYETGAPIPKPKTLPDETRGEVKVRYSGDSGSGRPEPKSPADKLSGLSGEEKIETVKKAVRSGRINPRNRNTQLGEDWQKSNRNDGVDGMSQKSVDAYKRENPGSKLKTAVTGKVKKGSKDAKRRKSFCARSKGQMDMHNIDCKKTPEKKICKARKRWRC